MSTKKITQSGFYHLSKIQASEIFIKKDISVEFFDSGKIHKKIFVGENAKLHIFGLLEKEEDYKIQIVQNQAASSLEAKYLLLSENGQKTKATIHSRIESDGSVSDVKIISFTGENWEIDIDGIIDLAKNHKKMKGFLKEENIFIGNKAKVRGLPTLLVASNDVEASHACKIQKISDEKLFYLRSRGVEKTDAVEMILASKFEEIFWATQNLDEKLYTSLRLRVLGG